MVHRRLGTFVLGPPNPPRQRFVQNPLHSCVDLNPAAIAVRMQSRKACTAPHATPMCHASPCESPGRNRRSGHGSRRSLLTHWNPRSPPISHVPRSLPRGYTRPFQLRLAIYLTSQSEVGTAPPITGPGTPAGGLSHGHRRSCEPILPGLRTSTTSPHESDRLRADSPVPWRDHPTEADSRRHTEKSVLNVSGAFSTRVISREQQYSH